MSFVERAKSLHSQGEVVRTAIVLAKGLRRDPARADALDWFLHLYVEELPKPGLEEELFRVLELTPNGLDLYELIRDELRRIGSHDKLEALDQLLAIRGFQLQRLPVGMYGSASVSGPLETLVPPSHEQEEGAEVTEELPVANTGASLAPNLATNPASHDAASAYGDPPTEETQPRERWEAFDNPLESSSGSGGIPHYPESGALLRTVDDLPEELREEYTGSQPIVLTPTPPPSRNLWLIVLAIVVLIVVLSAFALLSQGTEEVTPWITDGSGS